MCIESVQTYAAARQHPAAELFASCRVNVLFIPGKAVCLSGEVGKRNRPLKTLEVASRPASHSRLNEAAVCS